MINPNELRLGNLILKQGFEYYSGKKVPDNGMSKIKLSQPPLPTCCDVKLEAYPIPECDANYQPPVMPQLIIQYYRDAQQRVNRYREEIIIDRLKQLGHILTTQEEKEAFAKERLVFISRADHHPDWRELYLYPEMTFIASWWETVSFETFTDESYSTMGKIVFGDHPKSRL